MKPSFDREIDVGQDAPTAPHRVVLDEVKKLHLNKADFDEGDLSHRVDRFDRYVMAIVPVSSIDLHEFALDESTVSEYAAQYRATGTYPRIVFDAVDGSMIDGLHRANALAQCGLTEIDAYIGVRQNVDPHWHRHDDDDAEADALDEDGADDELSSEEIAFLRTVVRPR